MEKKLEYHIKLRHQYVESYEESDGGFDITTTKEVELAASMTYQQAIEVWEVIGGVIIEKEITYRTIGENK